MTHQQSDTEQTKSKKPAAHHELLFLTRASVQETPDHELLTAPLFTRDAYEAAELDSEKTQYGLFGAVQAIRGKKPCEIPDDPRLYVNTNAPFSALVCGVQGSGKSHTVAVLLENMLIPNFKGIGALEKPLAGLVLHFGEGGPSARPSEAVWLGVPHYTGMSTPPVRVYVSRSSYTTMKRVYADVGHNVSVKPLLFSESELDAEAFLTMMAVSSTEGAPLYIQIILSILRDLGENFAYQVFKEQLEKKKQSFNPRQLSGLDQRMAMMEAFMTPTSMGGSTPAPARFAAGQLTIIDLSDPFVDPVAACSLFEIVTRLFIRADVGTGKVLVVDEAHKYLTTNAGGSGLTNTLLSLIRQQRHLAMRVIISTQEPTVVPPVLLDLCTITILHRFSSPSWWEHVTKHVSADLSSSAFDRIVKLRTGEAMVLAPSGLAVLRDIGTEGVVNPNAEMFLCQLGRRYILMKTRNRATVDRGASILVLEEVSKTKET